ncbi:hypothetical protein FHR59_003850 [Xanthomonas arboricola]|uniref:hypothetical protein n=1 Tax=Xanthomonas TaxID=338 RepID=UPI0011B0C97C|nr:hypothetical protein [Xanthomonas arboricola]MBB6339553.1 hypothetical protein [Xanthomonas arboricola]NIK45605.1 hypothetical protein [Xanthomonas arboricola]
MKISLSLLATVCLFSILISSCTDKRVANTIPPDCTVDARNEERCFTTFDRLSKNPNDYDGNVVLISGYLVIDRGALSIYSNEIDYAHMIFQDNVIIISAPESVQEKAFKEFGYRYVRIQGRFRKSVDPLYRRYEVGEIRLLGDVTELPARVEVGKREGWEQALIKAGDINR